MTSHGATIATILASLFLAFVAGCGSRQGEKSQPPPVSIVKGVELQDIREEVIDDETEAVGTVRARNSADIAARIPGVISSIVIREGDHVAKGRLLLTIDAAESMAGAAAARAAADEALRGVDEARTRKRLAETTFNRYSTLLREEAVTRQEFDGRRMERDVARQSLARAEARLVQSREGARAAGAVAGYTRIVAPLHGIVTSRKVDVGMTVFPGTPLLTVEEEGHYRLEADVPDYLLGKVKVGDQARVVIDGIGELNGNAVEVEPASDPASRTFRVKVDIAAKGLRSGIFGRAYFAGGSHDGLQIPRGAVIKRGALTSVWIVGNDKIARMRLIRAGKEKGSLVEVLSGLSPGERVAIGGIDRIVDGVKVE